MKQRKCNSVPIENGLKYIAIICTMGRTVGLTGTKRSSWLMLHSHDGGKWNGFSETICMIRVESHLSALSRILYMRSRSLVWRCFQNSNAYGPFLTYKMQLDADRCDSTLILLCMRRCIQSSCGLNRLFHIFDNYNYCCNNGCLHLSVLDSNLK